MTDPSKQTQAQEQQIKSGIQKARDLAAQSAANETSNAYGFLEEQLDQIESQAGEAVEDRLDLPALLAKLDKNKPLAPADLKTLELLIVGDAESYLKYESETDEWKAQLKRVLDQIAGLQNATLDVDTLMQLRALCREAHESIADLVYYFDAKERVDKFRSATAGTIDAEGYKFLANIVREMLTSDKM